MATFANVMVRVGLGSVSAILTLLAAGACSSGSGSTDPASPLAGHTTASQPAPGGATRTGPSPDLTPPFRDPLPGMPPAVANNVYGAAGPGMLSRKVADEPAYLYVPNSYGAPYTTVIDKRTHKIVRVL